MAATLGLLYPPCCTICGRALPVRPAAILVCRPCRSELAAGGPVCARCARPLPRGFPPSGEDCPACRNRRFHFAGVTALGIYEGVWREVVLRTKRASNEPLTVAMGQLLALRLRGRKPPDLVAPVPMHWLRRLGRGVNGPEVLAESIGRARGWPVATDLLRCRRKTSKQGTLMPGERRANVRAAFAASAGYDISSASVLVVDDVMTTGATANEVARVLRRAGARSVSLAVVARGIGFD